LIHGFSREVVYIVLTMMLLLVPILSAMVILCSETKDSFSGLYMKGKTGETEKV